MPRKTPPKIDHLKKYQFQPGCKPGPGRPKPIYSDAHRYVASLKPIQLKIDINKDTVAVAIAKKAAQLLIDGKMAQLAEVTDRVDGKALQGIRIEGNSDGDPIHFQTDSPQSLAEIDARITELTLAIEADNAQKRKANKNK